MNEETNTIEAPVSNGTEFATPAVDDLSVAAVVAEAAKTMEENPPVVTPRGMAEVQKEYGQLCGIAGELQYQISMYAENLKEINRKLQTVNREAATLQQAVDKRAAADRANHEKQTQENFRRAEEKRARKAAELTAKNETTQEATT